MDSKELKSSIIIAAVIQCNKCAKIDAEEGTESGIDSAAQVFYDDGWREINNIVYCGSCVEKMSGATIREGEFWDKDGKVIIPPI